MVPVLSLPARGASEAQLDAESSYIGALDDPDRMEWSTHEQGRGQLFHRWAARLINLLFSLNQDRLKDDVECPKCGAEPNLKLAEGEQEYQEGNACPVCDESLVRKTLTDVALDLLIDVGRRHLMQPV